METYSPMKAIEKKLHHIGLLHSAMTYLCGDTSHVVLRTHANIVAIKFMPIADPFSPQLNKWSEEQ